MSSPSSNNPRAPSTGRTLGMAGLLVVLLIALVAVIRGGMPRISTSSTPSSAAPTPALGVGLGVQPALAPAQLSSADEPLQPIIGTNIRDQQVADVMPVPPTMSWPETPHMWHPLPNNADYVVAMVDANDRWMISLWRGPAYVPTGDSVGVHHWEMPAELSPADVLNARNALMNILQQQGRLRDVGSELQPQP